MADEHKPSGSLFARWLRERFDYEPYLRILSGAFLYGALDARLHFREALEKQLRKPVPAYAFKHLWCMGGIALLLFGNQVVTGILLLVYYKPSTEMAYHSVQHIMNEVPMGWLIRQMHAWGAHLMVIAVLIHMFKVFLNKAYRPPRELTWVSGTILLLLTLTFAFTGYLLPWSQLSYWATTVGTESMRAMPVLGRYLLILTRGGEMVSDVTLSRFFALHCVILPWVMVAFMVAHFAMIRQQGISEPL